MNGIYNAFSTVAEWLGMVGMATRRGGEGLLNASKPDPAKVC